MTLKGGNGNEAASTLNTTRRYVEGAGIIRRILTVVLLLSLSSLAVAPAQAAPAPAPAVAARSQPQAGGEASVDAMAGLSGATPLSAAQMAAVGGNFQFLTFIGGLGAMIMGGITIAEGVHVGNPYMVKRGITQVAVGGAAAIYGATH